MATAAHACRGVRNRPSVTGCRAPPGRRRISARRHTAANRPAHSARAHRGWNGGSADPGSPKRRRGSLTECTGPGVHPEAGGRRAGRAEDAGLHSTALSNLAVEETAAPGTGIYDADFRRQIRPSSRLYHWARSAAVLSARCSQRRVMQGEPAPPRPGRRKIWAEQEARRTAVLSSDARGPELSSARRFTSPQRPAPCAKPCALK
ncbi:uncharacterized protein BDZ99DRAFT_470216 [Mytilinidion resinicola]|uniref:Uncharacterized protein n=1 Tax=Mytilinidion resinicola TaxID=574789 RepID=A0A6A6Z7T9_9PEZI|nr:uncharacterized protein BDZ99DRAFT_470216 [Mytilinidion resinicola]KAF2817172.1 hypothetical protein BDZ99DRAFT_470216 [Mytilinidion resinicola]